VGRYNNIVKKMARKTSRMDRIWNKSFGKDLLNLFQNK
jgi:hypothetical protein